MPGFIWPHTMPETHWEPLTRSGWPLCGVRESAPVCLRVYIFLGESLLSLSLSLLPSQPHKQASGQNHYATIFQFIQCLQLLISVCLLHKEGALSEAVSKELTGASSSIWTLGEEMSLTTGHCCSDCRDFLYHLESSHHLLTEAMRVRYNMPDVYFHLWLMWYMKHLYNVFKIKVKIKHCDVKYRVIVWDKVTIMRKKNTTGR